MSQTKPQCDQCGTDRKSPLAREVKTYGKWAWFLILFGISSKPTAVQFQCSKCGQIFDQLSPEELQHFV
ncbi:hypothetical protein ACE5IS_18685 [Leptospira wolffii]|uniref:Zinc-ribbon domain-containing protein n=1 Tax=Leptospira wolffii TaxID=409998 RepID=A0A2M9Z931_9LEPT|nr:hypothetical protein LEP1GSC061_1145 [Leptospira wolffii serovar Khorat str. Khorat-H2]PJZ64928.1 hypothetical protein CH371_15620 [Leptospira wolffii]